MILGNLLEMRLFLLHLFLGWVTLTPVSAQVLNSGLMNSDTGEHIGNLSIGAYLDAYFGYDFSRPEGGQVPYFVSMNRHNEATVNLAFVDIRYESERVRGRLVPGFGTYINANYQNEPGTLKNLVEASVGFQVFKEKEIWVDFGVLGSPYTNESAISRDHLMYTRSFAPEYVPYYLSGAKFTLPLSGKLTAYLYLLNGWQQIRDQNSGKALGTQLEYRPDKKNLINWNTYWGDERSSDRPEDRLRAFSDVYWIHDGDGKWDFTSCLYAGFQNNLMDRFNSKVFWWQANFIARYHFTEKIALSGRMEYFSDPNSIQITAELQPPFQAFSNGLCLNLTPQSNLLLRIEGRYFYSSEALFQQTAQQTSKGKFWMISGITFSF